MFYQHQRPENLINLNKKYKFEYFLSSYKPTRKLTIYGKINKKIHIKLFQFYPSVNLLMKLIDVLKINKNCILLNFHKFMENILEI